MFCITPVNGKVFSSHQFEKAKNMLAKPWEYSTREKPKEYSQIVESVAELIRSNNHIMISSCSMEKALGVSFQKIADAFEVPDTGSKIEIIRQKLQVKFGCPISTRKHGMIYDSYKKLERYVSEKYNGKVIRLVNKEKDIFEFKCKEHDHATFCLRKDKVKIRWCKLCRKKLKGNS